MTTADPIGVSSWSPATTARPEIVIPQTEHYHGRHRPTAETRAALTLTRLFHVARHRRR